MKLVLMPEIYSKHLIPNLCEPTNFLDDLYHD